MKRFATTCSIILVSKIEFPSDNIARKASSLIGDYKHAVLGSAIVIPITRHNSNHVANVTLICGGTPRNDRLTDFDYHQLI
jgi:hypothetical protein